MKIDTRRLTMLMYCYVVMLVIQIVIINTKYVAKDLVVYIKENSLGVINNTHDRHVYNWINTKLAVDALGRGLQNQQSDFQHRSTIHSKQ